MKYKRLISLTLIFSIILTSSISQINVLANNKSVSETVQFIFKYDTDYISSLPATYGRNTDSEVNILENVIESNLTSASDVQIDEAISDLSFVSNIGLVTMETNDVEKTLNELNSTNGIIYAEPNYRISLASFDEHYDMQWGLHGDNGIDADKAWSLTAGADDVIVAIIDTGIDINHSDLLNNVYTNPLEIVDGLDNDGNGYIDDINGWDFTTYIDSVNNGDNSVYDDEDVDSHGTHIAGIVSAAKNGVGIQGVAYGSRILPLKVLGSDGGTVFSAIKAIEYAENLGANIVNCSWTTENYSQFLYNIIKNSDMLFVCAAGNYGNDVTEVPVYPAMFDLDNLISVAASTVDGELASYSNYGEGVDIAAPGSDIYSTLPSNEYGYQSGTSMAAPFVTGCAALLMSYDIDLTTAQIKKKIISSYNMKYDLRYEFEDKVDSGGLINACDLLYSCIDIIGYDSSHYCSECVQVGNDMYLVGGFIDGEFMNYLYCFKPEINDWIKINCPYDKYLTMDSAVGTYNDMIYIFGGFNNETTDTIMIYTPSEDLWQTDEMPEPLYATAYAQIEDKIYFFGGISGSTYKNTIYEFDFKTWNWTKKNDLPFNLAYASAINVDGSIYLFGGCNENECLDTIYQYFPQDDSLQFVTKMSTSRRDFSVAYDDGRIYIFGGRKSYSNNVIEPRYEYAVIRSVYADVITDIVDVFYINKSICEPVDYLKHPLASTASINYFDNIYLFGGWNGAYPYSIQYYFGNEYPKDIRLKSVDDSLNIVWESNDKACGYNIEINGQIYHSENNCIIISADEQTEYRVRIQTVFDENSSKSLWSDYAYYYFNSSIDDAKAILHNSSTKGKLYSTGQTKWYKIDNTEYGRINITLSDIPSGCSFVMQLCDSIGNVIETANASEDSLVINSVVLEPYDYYIKIYSVYGGSFDNEYILNCAFSPLNDEYLPSRLKAAYSVPASVDSAVFEDDNDYVNISEFDGEIPELTSGMIMKQSNDLPLNTDSGFESNNIMSTHFSDAEKYDYVSPQRNSYYNETVKYLNYVGATYTDSISVNSSVSNYSERCKVVIEVEPSNVNDVMSVEWTGTNTNYNNFWWHCTGGIYYLTAILDVVAGVQTYSFTIRYKTKAQNSNGKYILRKYINYDSSINEDYNNVNGGNDLPGIAQSIDPSLNSYQTVTGKIDHKYDLDCYYITANSNEKITAYLEYSDGLNYALYALDNRCVQNSFNSSEYMDSWYVSDENYSFSNFIGESTNSQIYCIMVASRDGKYSYDDGYTLSVYKHSLSEIGDLEINNDFAQADTQIQSFNNDYLGNSSNESQTIDFSIDSPVDVDRYPLDLQAGDKITIQMTMPDNYIDSIYKYRIEIHSDIEYRDNGDVHYNVNSHNNPDSHKTKFSTYVAETSGRYYVAIRSLTHKYDYSMIGALNITKVNDTELDDFEHITMNYTNDFIFTTLIAINGIHYGIPSAVPLEDGILSCNIDNEFDVDWYMYTNGGEPKTIKFNISSYDDIKLVALDTERNILSSGYNENTYFLSPYSTYYFATYIEKESFDETSSREYMLSATTDNHYSELVFRPVNWGTFIYDNNPEFITEDDLADYDRGNRYLVSEKGLTGVVDFQSSHSVKPYMFDNGSISFDMYIHNPTNKTVKFKVEKIGYQTPKQDKTNTDATYTRWACLQAWADYLQFNLNFDCFKDNDKEEYKAYSFKGVSQYFDNDGEFTLAANESIWLFGDKRPTLLVKDWAPFNMVMRVNILNDGVLDMSFAAFRDVNKVKSPQNATVIYDISQRDTENIPADSLEPDMGGKPKGKANSVAETEAKTTWYIDDSTQYFTPTIYNYSNPQGYKINSINNYYWYTNYNPNSDINNNNNYGVESEFIPLVFEEKSVSDSVINSWIFDLRHTNLKSGNYEFSDESVPVDNGMNLGNYGVTQRYFIDVVNTTDEDKYVSYYLRTASHAFVIYKDYDLNKFKLVIKTSVFRSKDESFEHYLNAQKEEMFRYKIPAGETKQLYFELILPNADCGGFGQQLVVN